MDGQVLVESDLVGPTLDVEEFDEACDAVATITDHIGESLVARFGGETFFADKADAPVVDESKVQTGLYL